MKFLLHWLKKRWVYHSTIWTMLLIGLSILLEGSDKQTSHIEVAFRITFETMLPILCIVYSNFYIKSLFFQRKKYFKYAFMFLFNNLVFGFVSSWLGEDSAMTTTDFLADVLFEMMGAMLLATITNSLQFLKRTIINNNKLKYELQEFEVQTTKMELNSLKAQINPHFLFNNLNNIYAINQIDSQKGSEMILELAEVMRYHLQFSQQQQVLLADEIQLIKSYIELEKLRLNGNCDLQIHIQERESNILIAPLLLLPFIENAFKHGTHPTEKCFVHLSLATHQKHLSFELKNSIIKNKKVVKNHIGLTNTEKRLELIYPQKHQLISEKNDKIYCVNLEINL